LVRSFFDTEYVPTIQDSFDMIMHFQGKSYKLVIIDTAGQEEMGSITNLAIKNADAYILMYSVTVQRSFDVISSLYAKILEISGKKKVNAVIVGNKIDLEDERIVSCEQGRAKAAPFGCPFIEVSAKTGSGVKELFEKCLEQMAPLSGSPEKPIRAEKTTEADGGCCSIE
jgi:small GTP-binding protein